MLRKIDAMHALFGAAHGATCKLCPHITSYRYNGRNIYKCKAYGNTRSEATDWRLWYPACMLIFVNLKKDHVPVFDRLQHGACGSDGGIIPGQLTMFEEETDGQRSAD